MLQVADENEKLAQLIARKTGKTPEAVVRQSVEATARAAGVSTPAPTMSSEEFITGMKAIADRCAARPVLDNRSPHDTVPGFGARHVVNDWATLHYVLLEHLNWVTGQKAWLRCENYEVPLSGRGGPHKREVIVNAAHQATPRGRRC